MKKVNYSAADSPTQLRQPTGCGAGGWAASGGVKSEAAPTGNGQWMTTEAAAAAAGRAEARWSPTGKASAAAGRAGFRSGGGRRLKVDGPAYRPMHTAATVRRGNDEA